MSNNNEKEKNTVKTVEKLQDDKKVVGVPFKKGHDPRRNYDGRPRGKRDWSTDFRLAIEMVAEQTGKTESEIRTALLSKGLQEAMRGDSRFWTYIIDREYGKETQPIDGDFRVPGTEKLADALQELLNNDNDIPDNKKTKGGIKKNG